MKRTTWQFFALISQFGSFCSYKLLPFIAPQTCAKIQYKYTYVSMKGLYNLANKQECTLGAVVGLKRDGCVCLTDFS